MVRRARFYAPAGSRLRASLGAVLRLGQLALAAPSVAPDGAHDREASAAGPGSVEACGLPVCRAPVLRPGMGVARPCGTLWLLFLYL